MFNDMEIGTFFGVWLENQLINTDIWNYCIYRYCISTIEHQLSSSGIENYFILSSSAIANCRSVLAFSPNGSNIATASSASFFSSSLAFSIPTTAG